MLRRAFLGSVHRVIMRKNVWLILWAVVMSSLPGWSVQAETFDERNPLRPGEVVKSPDRRFRCWTEALPGGGAILWLEREGEKKTQMRSSQRSIGVCWSPDSRWLAVSDNCLAAEAAVLIYDCSQATRPLVYQSPFSATEQDIWSVVGWNVEKQEVTLSRSRRFSSEEDQKTVVILTNKPIKPIF